MDHPRFVLRGFVTAALSLALVASVSAQVGRAVGVVKDEGGQAIKGATLTFENDEASPNSFTATSDDKGRFSVIGLKSGPWSVLVGAPGFEPQAGQLQIRAATPGVLAFTMKKAPAPPPSALGTMAAKDLQAELRTADQFFNAEQWDQAVAAYKAILARAPALSVINLQVGAAYRNKKDYDNALAAYNELLKIDPNSDKARIGIGMTNLEKGDLTAAESTLTQAAQSPTAGKEVFYTLGEVEFARGQVDEAMKWYSRASTDDPNWGKPLLQLGLCSAKKGDTTGAARFMARVIEVDPMSPEATRAKSMIEELRKVSTP